jgi:hypothetical protein
LFFQPEQYFSLTKNQPTVFFSRLIIPAERLHIYKKLTSVNLFTMASAKEFLPEKKSANEKGDFVAVL